MGHLGQDKNITQEGSCPKRNLVSSSNAAASTAIGKRAAPIIVVTDMDPISPESGDALALPSALQSLDEILERANQRKIVVFLDYDGTLTPIVEDPDQALLSDSMRETLQELSLLCTVSVISGRDLRDLQAMVGLDGPVYAGCHGFEISVPRSGKKVFQQGKDYLPDLDRAERRLKKNLEGITGARLERKRYSIAVHFRQVRESDIRAVERAVNAVQGAFPRLRKTRGKKVFELQPAIAWNKGKALTWILDTLDVKGSRGLPVYLGDDVTDEDAFEAVRKDGVGILITDAPRPSKAGYSLRDPGEVERFLKILISITGGSH